MSEIAIMDAIPATTKRKHVHPQQQQQQQQHQQQQQQQQPNGDLAPSDADDSSSTTSEASSSNRDTTAAALAHLLAPDSPTTDTDSPHDPPGRVTLAVATGIRWANAHVPGMPRVTAFAVSKWINVRRHALKAKHAIKLSFFGTLFAVILAISNLFQVAALFLRPIHKKTVAAVNSKVLRAVWGYIQYMLERRHRAQITFSGHVMHLPYNVQRTMPWTQRDDLPPPASAFVIANHLFFCDFVLEHAVAIRRNMLGHCRYLSKDSHKHWPLFGWLIRLAGFVFLKRNWEQDQALISRRIAEWKAGNQAIWMVVYPEGTRQTPSKLRQSQAWSIKHDKPYLSNVLFPRTKGFVAILKQLRASHFTHVLDFTVAAYHLPTGTFNEVFPTGFDLFSKRLDALWKFHVHVDQFDITDLPEEDAEVEAWLIGRWVEKDKRLQEWRDRWPVVGESGGECTGEVYDMPWPWS